MDLSDLKTWCDQARGRRSEAARALGTSKQAITDWFACRLHPTEEQRLAIQDFLHARTLVLSTSDTIILPDPVVEGTHDSDEAIPAPFTPEEEAANDAILAELEFPKEPVRPPYDLTYSDAIPAEAWDTFFFSR
jgi:hypothetical protein